MRIAQVSPLYESVPPKLYGGTERVVSYLTEELVKLGHEVILFASADSQTKAQLIPVCPKALRLDSNTKDPIVWHLYMFEEVYKRANMFDIIHFHTEYLHLPLATRHSTPFVSTLHGRLDLPEYKPLFKIFKDAPFVSISNSQRKPLPWLNWQATVYHGLPEDLYKFYPESEKYLAFLGRISPEKRPDRAIEIAEKFGMKLKIAAKVDKADENYFNEIIKPMLKNPWVEFIGEIGEKEKNEFLGNAYALIFPIDWPEPFGLVMIEALACGTPVVAWNCGSVPEIIENGKTGYIVNSIEEAIKALDNISSIDRKACRICFEQRFTARRMAEDYLKVYKTLVKEEILLEVV
ncbi:glycosyltransferase family 4 protein [Thermodesulfobacterium hydrogeniphilum]|uniref:glycosyltransferase family 4 protein n=1 Tax=Thermodesulfobacterium hydrogeniphilum TaxID=161156 RepID=UPI000571F710|nr:glycosyltransferase family 4 protein [Thermodesulfobacterium hydrogeniphilum]